MAVYLIIAFLSWFCGVGMTILAIGVYGWWASKQTSISPTIELDTTILAEVLAEKQELEAIQKKAATL